MILFPAAGEVIYLYNVEIIMYMVYRWTLKSVLNLTKSFFHPSSVWQKLGVSLLLLLDVGMHGRVPYERLPCSEIVRLTVACKS